MRAIPTILLTRAGREVVRFEGPVSERTLIYHLDRLSGDYTGENPEAANATESNDDATSPVARLRRLLPWLRPPRTGPAEER